MTELLSTREAARFDLIRRSASDDDGLRRAFEDALELSAHTLGVARVGLWLFDEELPRIRCHAQYSLAGGHEPSGEIIDLTTCPAYAVALRSRRVVAADDARTDPRTAELMPYLERHDIFALLDSPVFRQGEPFAIVCHEHVGAPRNWSKQDCHFAATVSDMLGLYCEQYASQQHHRALMEARRALEEQRVMESLGRFSAAIAHDFNNVLGAIGLQAELLEAQAQRAGAASEIGKEIGVLVEQGGRLVRQLLDFARKDPAPTELTDLCDVARSMEPLLRTFGARGITYALELSDSPMVIRLARSQAEQVLMNLVMNARDALLGGGHLTISVQAEEATPSDQAHATLRVSDTGVGMDAQTRERVFEPFFTTKPRGQGQGLGLPTVYRIVSASGGSIDIRSAPSAGTDFTVRWPLATP